MNLFTVLFIKNIHHIHKHKKTEKKSPLILSEMFFRVSTNKSNSLLQAPFTTIEPRLFFLNFNQKINYLDLLLICSKLFEKQYNFWN